MPQFDARITLRRICDHVSDDQRLLLLACKDDQLRLAEALCALLRAHRLRDKLSALVGALLANLSEWHRHKPDVALRVLVDVATGEALCTGVLSVANIALERRVRVDEQAPIAARALVRCLGDSDGLSTSALMALAALGRAAPRALVPVWHAVLPLALVIGREGSVDERAAAADCASSLLVGGTKLSTSNRACSSHAFTSTAEYVHRYCVDVARAVEYGIRMENDRGVLAKVVKTAAVVGTLAIPGENCERILCALLDRVRSDAENAVGVAALKAIANILNSKNEGLGNEVVVQVVEHVVREIMGHRALGVEESLLVLQAACACRVLVVWTKWPDLQPVLVALAEGDHDVIALHAVRVGVKLLDAFAGLENHSDTIYQLAGVYQALYFRAHHHSFHPIRTAAVLAAELLLRISGSQVGRITTSARDALLRAAVNDVSVPVSCVAVRALSAVAIEKDDEEACHRIVSQLYTILVQPDSPKVLQARCAWSLAAIVDKAFRVFRRFETDLMECVRGCEMYALQMLNDRIDGLSRGNRVRGSDSDTCATGLVRLIGAISRCQTANNCVVQGSTVQCLCIVVGCAKEAPKTRWNACTALGDVLHARHDKNAVDALYHACHTADMVKVRTAAARALLPAATLVGVSRCVKLFEGARNVVKAPHDAIEACARATAALVHDALADSECGVEVGVNPKMLVDAIAVHTQLPSYVLNPRAKLPPEMSLSDSPREAIKALPTVSLRALAAVVDVAERNKESGALASHLRDVLELNVH